jgi:hypothetical protein
MFPSKMLWHNKRLLHNCFFYSVPLQQCSIFTLLLLSSTKRKTFFLLCSIYKMTSPFHSTDICRSAGTSSREVKDTKNISSFGKMENIQVDIYLLCLCKLIPFQDYIWVIPLHTTKCSISKGTSKLRKVSSLIFLGI